LSVSESFSAYLWRFIVFTKFSPMYQSISLSCFVRVGQIKETF